MERANTYEENGHVVAFTFAAIDVEKSGDLGNDTHGSKIIVVPFDGAKFDAENGGTSNSPSVRHSSSEPGISINVKVPAKTVWKTFFIPAEAASGAAGLSAALYDLKGRLVAHHYKGPATGKSQEIIFDLDGSMVGPGVYCITVHHGNRDFSGRLNVE
jgi:hypothetical protein